MPAKIHPKSKKAQPLLRETGIDDNGSSSFTATALTVWRKSLVLHCNGFTVFDGKGTLAFRVDNYYAGPINEVLLMDAHGNSLLTMTRKRFSLHNEWQAFSGDKSNGDGEKPLFRVRRPRLRLPTKASLAEILVMKSRLHYRIEGSYAKRSCTIYDHNSKHIVAEVRRKQVTSEIRLGEDVFEVRVQRGYDPAFVIGVIVILDQMIASNPNPNPNPNPNTEDGINFTFPFSWACCWDGMATKLPHV